MNKDTKIDLDKLVLTEDLTKSTTDDLKEVNRVGWENRLEKKNEIRTETEKKL